MFWLLKRVNYVLNKANSESIRKRNSQLAKHSYSRLEQRLPLTTFFVNSLVDDALGIEDGLISLREAIVAANTNSAFGDAVAGELDGDVIQFDIPVGSTYTLTEGQLDISDDLLVHGGNFGLTIDGNRETRLFQISSGEQVRLDGLKFFRGSAELGGAIFSTGSGETVVANSSFVRNTSTNGQGGAVFSESDSFRSLDSSYFENRAQGALGYGGALFVANGASVVSGGVFDQNFAGRNGGAASVWDGSLSVVNVEMGKVGSGNLASNFGAGLHINDSATAFVTGSTIEENRGGDGSGIFNQGTLTIRESSIGMDHVVAISNDGGVVYGKELQVSGDSGISSSSGKIVLIDSVIRAKRHAIIAVDGFVGLFNSDIKFHEFGAIRLIGSADLVVEGGQITENVASIGGSIYVSENSTVFIRNNAVVEGTAFEAGGGIFNDKGQVFIANSTITGYLENYNVGLGAGIFSSVGKLIISNSNIRGEGGESGGGIFVSGGFTQANNSTISGTAVTSGGGLAIRGDASFVLSGGEVRNSEVLDFGGGIWVGDEDATLFVRNGASISSNKTLVLDGGGIYNQGGSVYINDSTIDQNQTIDGSAGGGIFSVGGRVVVVDSTISNNKTNSTGGGVFVVDGYVHLKNSQLINNSAVSYLASSDMHVRGGGLYADGNSQVLFNGGVISGNTSMRRGGGIWIEPNASVFLKGTTVTNNSAVEFAGGAMYVRGFLSTIDSVFESNTAEGFGGAMLVAADGRLRSESTRFASNSSGESGGAIYSGGYANVFDSVFESNAALIDGGGIFTLPEGTTISTNNTFTGNTPNDTN